MWLETPSLLVFLHRPFRNGGSGAWGISERVIARRDAFKSKQIFYDVVKEYWNEDYWKDYNIIEPTESLENAVKKLRKQL